jgi:hypothetical protein
MAEVYLNPENDVNWATDNEADMKPQSDADARESVRAAGTLLKQLKPSDMHTSKHKVVFWGWGVVGPARQLSTTPTRQQVMRSNSNLAHCGHVSWHPMKST